MNKMMEGNIHLLAAVLSFVVFCGAKPNLTKETVDFFRAKQNITGVWQKLDKQYQKVQVKYCDTTSTSTDPCILYDVNNVLATRVSFPVRQFAKYKCLLRVQDVGGVMYESPRMMDAKFRPDMTSVTFVQEGDKITGTWKPFGSGYTSLRVVFCLAETDDSCDQHAVANISATEAIFRVDKKEKYKCSVVLIDVSGVMHSSTPVIAKVNTPSDTTIIIVVVIVVIIAVIIAVAIVLYFVLRHYCNLRDRYHFAPDTEKEKKKSVKRLRKQSVDAEHMISEDDFGTYNDTSEKGKDNHAFQGNEKGKKNGAVKGPKDKKSNKYKEPKIEFRPSEAFVDIDLNQPDTVSLSSQSSQGDESKFNGGELVVDVEASTPGVFILPELNRKMSTDLDAISDVVDDAEVSVDIEVEAPVGAADVCEPYVRMSRREPDRDEYVKMGSDEESTPFNDVNVDISVTPAPDMSSESDTSSLRSSRSGLDVEIDGDIASRGSIDMADTRFNDARYDGSLDLRFAGLSRGSTIDDDDDDSDSAPKPAYEPLESEEDIGHPPLLKTQGSLDSVEELNLDLAYGDTFRPEDPGPVGVDAPTVGLGGNVDIGVDIKPDLEPTETLDVDPFDTQYGNDAILDHVGAVIDADRDGGLIHVQDGNADVDIVGGELSFDTPEKNIGGDSAPNSSSEKVEPKNIERKISRKCSKLGRPDHVCSHVPKEGKHSRSSSSSSCSTCTSTESSSPTFSRTYSSSGSDTENDVKDIEDEVGHDTNRSGLQISGSVDVDDNVEIDNALHGGPGAEIDVDTGLEVDAVLSVPAGFADEVNIGAEDPNDDFDFGGGLPRSTGLNLDVELGIEGSV